MPSSATARNRFEKQGSGENENTWGTKLNTALMDLVDAALDGIASYTLSGSRTLSSTNYAADEARMRVQNITGGTGGTITIPSVEKVYHVRNNSSGNVVFTTGSGATATVPTATVSAVICDGTNVYLDNSATVASAAAAAEAAVAAAEDATEAAAAAAAAAAGIDSGNIVHVSGTETVTGAKSFSAPIAASAGVVINGQTLDGLTATGLSVAEAASQSAARAAIGSSFATAAEVRALAANATITPANVAGGSAIVTLTDAATIAFDWTSGVNFDVALAGNRTLGNPTNVVAGTFRFLLVKAASGTRTLNLDSNFKGTTGAVVDVTTSRYYLYSLFAYATTHIVVARVVAL